MVELRLSEMEGGKSHGKDLDDVKATELRLGLPGTEKSAVVTPRGSKRPLPEGNEERQSMTSFSEEDPLENGREVEPITKAQVVGWPPIRTFRKNRFQARQAEADAAGIYVKVSMDGAPYLRKIDLEVYKGYKELRESLEDMFKCFSLGALHGMERKSGSEYAITYEDKDGDWMLVGDVPWEMFASSCKRLRIMRGSEARGLGSSP